MDNIDLEKLEELIQKQRPEAIITEGRKPFVALPDNLTLHDLDEFALAPDRVKRNIKVTDVATFNDYFTKWAQHGTEEIFADIENRTVVLVLDEHIAIREGNHEPQWLNHRCSYECPLSREWQAWTDHDGNRFSQVEFAEFLEDRIAEVVDPAGAELTELITNFNLKRDVNFSNAVRLEDGHINLAYSEINEPGGNITVPQVFTLAMAPFHNGTVYSLKARLRYRMNSGSLTLWYDLIEPWRVLEHAFCAPVPEPSADVVENSLQPVRSVCAQIAEHTGRDISMVQIGTL